MVLPHSVQQLVASVPTQKIELVNAAKSFTHTLLQTAASTSSQSNDKPWTWMACMLVFVAAFIGVYMQHTKHVEEGNKQHINFIVANAVSVIFVWAFGITTVIKINNNEFSAIPNYAWTGTTQQDCSILAFGFVLTGLWLFQNVIGWATDLDPYAGGVAAPEGSPAAQRQDFKREANLALRGSGNAVVDSENAPPIVIDSHKPLNGDTTFKTKAMVHNLGLLFGAVGFSLACVGGCDGEWLTLCFMCINIALFIFMIPVASHSLQFPRTYEEWPNKPLYIELSFCAMAGLALIPGIVFAGLDLGDDCGVPDDGNGYVHDLCIMQTLTYLGLIGILLGMFGFLFIFLECRVFKIKPIWHASTFMIYLASCLIFFASFCVFWGAFGLSWTKVPETTTS